MNLIRKKCGYCKAKVNKEKEVFRNVKNPAFVGTKKKAFCCSKHANSYEKEIEAHMENSKNRGGDRKSTRLNSSHIPLSRMPSSA